MSAPPSLPADSNDSIVVEASVAGGCAVVLILVVSFLAAMRYVRKRRGARKNQAGADSRLPRPSSLPKPSNGPNLAAKLEEAREAQIKAEQAAASARAEAEEARRQAAAAIAQAQELAQSEVAAAALASSGFGEPLSSIQVEVPEATAVKASDEANAAIEDAKKARSETVAAKGAAMEAETALITVAAEAAEARKERDTARAELKTAQDELDKARVELGAAQAELDKLRKQGTPEQPSQAQAQPAQAAGAQPTSMPTPDKFEDAISTTQSQQALLEKMATAPLGRFRAAVTKLVDTELAPLFNKLASEFEGAAKEQSAEIKLLAVADTINNAWGGLRAPLLTATSKNAALKKAIGEEAMAELRLVGRVAAASGAKVLSSVDWTTPSASKEAKEAATAIGEAQARAVAALQKKDAAAAKAPLDEVMGVVSQKLMPMYKARVGALKADEKREELYVTMPSVVEDLLPKFSKVYRGMADGLVRGETGYQAFNALEVTTLAPINAKGKPKQPLKALGELLALSVEAMPLFDALMSGVTREVNVGDKQGGVSPGGLSWQLGPLKKMNRVAEKLCLDPSQCKVLDGGEASALDASGICDTVRGMITCSTMAHAHHVLACLLRRFGPNGTDKARARCVRSKNRFARPSAGGWMDALLNIAVALPGDKWFVCEVQLVHGQLLLVRAELGAHHAYNDYRGAQEMLESAGCLELGSGDVLEFKGWLVRAIFTALLGPDRKPLLTENEATNSAALHALAKKQTWCLSRVGGGRPWPRLLSLNVDGRRVASVASEQAHRAVVKDALCGLLRVEQSGDENASLRVVEAAAGKQGQGLTLGSYRITGHSGAVQAVCVTPDGQHVVTAAQGQDEKARVFRFADGALLRTLDHTDTMYGVCVSPDGVHVITASGTAAHVFRLSDGSLVRKLEGHGGDVFGSCVTPDGVHVVTWSIDATARIWLLSDGSLVRTLQGHKGPVQACVSPDGVHVVTSSWDTTARVWRLSDGSLLRTLSGHTGVLRASCVSADGVHVVTVAEDKTVRVWRLSDGLHLRTIEWHTGATRPRMCLSPDGKYVVIGLNDNTARVWQLSDGAHVRTIEGHTDQVESVCMSPDGVHVVTASSDTTVRVWRLAESLVRTLQGHKEKMSSACLTPDGVHVVTASFDQTIRVWRLADGALVRTLEGIEDWVNSCCVSPDGVHVVAVFAKTARIWRLSDGAQLRTLDGHAENLGGASVSPDGKHVLTASWDKTVRIWLLSDGSHVRTLTGHTGRVFSACFSPDGNHVVTSSGDKTARVYRFANGSLVRTLEGHTEFVCSACVSPDGVHVVTASGDKTARVWRFADGALVHTLKGHTAQLCSACVSPDGVHVVTAGDLTGRVFRLSDGVLVRTLEGHTDEVNSACFSPDGVHVVTASDDKTARIFILTE